MSQPKEFLASAALQKITELEEALGAAVDAHHQPIAVIGMSCRLPGEVESPQAFWNFLDGNGDGISHDGDRRWRKIQPGFDDLSEDDRLAARHAGFINDFDCFDAMHFGITPREAETMDPQQRLALELAASCLHDAGISGTQALHGDTGIYLGVGGNEYLSHCQNAAPEDKGFLITGNASNVIAGRIAYLMGLRGPAVVVDTACSSALVAVHLAIQALRCDACRMALAGGVNMLLDSRTFAALSGAGMLSADGYCKTFDARADGYVRGEGGGVLALKKLTHAERDGDRILGVIRGSAVNQDGRSASLTAPNGACQQDVMRAALADARLTPDQVDFVETHGTGTPLGDPIEVAAIDAVYGVARQHPVMLGTLKPNIGHLEAASGIAGIVKSLLSLKHGRLPQNQRCEAQNPLLDFNADRLLLADGVTPLRKPENRPLRGAVSAFGFSGTNAHILLEAYPAPPMNTVEPDADDRSHLLALSGGTQAGLQKLCAAWAEAAEFDGPRLVDLAASLNVGMDHRAWRYAFRAHDAQEFRDGLRRVATGQLTATRAEFGNRTPRIGFMFTGQGSQYANMGRGLYQAFPAFRKAMDACAAALAPWLEMPILSVLWGENTGLLNQTAYTQPGLFAIQYALTRLWADWGIEPVAAVGHSVGEYAAACAAGILTLDDAARLIAKRGALMQALPEGGGMYVLRCDRDQARAIIRGHEDRISIAACNAPTQTVLSGDLEALDTALSDVEIWKLRLTVSHAFHSPLMQPIVEAFQQEAETAAYAEPTIQVFPTYRAENQTSQLDTPGYWAGHIRAPVEFMDALSAFSAQVDLVIEIGPRPLLTDLARQIIDCDPARWSASLRPGRAEGDSLRDVLANLYVAGCTLNWAQIHAGDHWQKQALPPLPYQRVRHWVRQMAGGVAGHPDADADKAHPLLGNRIALPTFRDTVYQSGLSGNSPAYLHHHRLFDTIVVPGASHVSMVLQAVTEAFGQDEICLENVVFLQPLVIPDHVVRRVQLQITGIERAGRYMFRVLSLDQPDRPHEEDAWRVHATGEIDLRADFSRPLNDLVPEVREERLHETLKETGPDFYRRMWGYGYTLGSAFQWVGDRYDSDHKAQVIRHDMTIPQTPDDISLYRFYPGLLDSCFQAFGSIANLTLDDDDIFIPFAFARMHVHQGSRWDGSVNLSRLTTPSSDERTIGDLTLIDDAGARLLEVQGLELRKSSKARLRAGLSQKDAMWPVMSTVWLPDGQYDNASTLQKGRWVVISAPAGEAALQSLLDTAMSQDGDCDLLYLSDVASGEDRATLSQRIAALGGQPIAGIIDARSLAESCRLEIGCDLGQRLGAVALGTLELVTGLQGCFDGSVPPLAILTRNAQDVPGEACDPLQHAHTRLARVIAHERPQLRVTFIDLPDDALANHTCAGTLRAALTRIGDEPEVALRQEVMVRRLKAVQPSEEENVTLPLDHTIVLTGGLGGIGLSFVAWLAAAGARHLSLLVRRAPSDAERARLDACRHMGARIQLIECDLGDAAAIAQAFDKVELAAPPIKAVFHLAGVVRDQFIDSMDARAFAEVLLPKAVAAWNLHLAVQTRAPELFVGFSSIASTFGTPGQANYAVANGFLDGLAAYRRALNMPGTAIAWGPWADIGMAARNAEVREASKDGHSMRRFGLEPIAPDDGFSKQMRVLHRTTTATPIVARIDWTEFIANFPGGATDPLFSGQRDLLPQNSREQENLLEALASLLPEERLPALVAQLRALLASILRLPDATVIDADTGFFDLGLDSLMSLEFRIKLERGYGLSLPPTVAFNHATLEALGAHLLEAHLRFAADEGPDATMAGSQQEISTDPGSLSDDALIQALERELLATESEA